MFNSEKQFEQIVLGLNVDTEPRPGHRKELAQQMLAAYEAGKGRSGRRTTWGVFGKRASIMKSKTIRIAAAAVILIAVGVVLVSVFDKGTTVAFAQVREQILAIQTMTCTFLMESSMEGNEQRFTAKMMFKEPQQMRMEFINPPAPEAEGMILIFNYDQGKMMTIMPSAKRAVVMNVGQLPDPQARQNFVEQIKEMMDGADESLGVKEIDGVEAHGFTVRHGPTEMEIWVDSNTLLPVVIKMKYPGISARYEMTDFAFDVELDDELFSLGVPEDYKTQTMDFPLSDTTEADLTAGLETVAKIHLDVFPPDIYPDPKFGQLVARYCATNGLDEEAALNLSNQFARMFMYLQTQGQRKDMWSGNYVGGGVRLGDPSSPVFWYQPTNSDSYRVVYGDLRVEDVSDEAELPSPPEPGESESPSDAEVAAHTVTLEAEPKPWPAQSLVYYSYVAVKSLPDAEDVGGIVFTGEDGYAKGSALLRRGYYEVTATIFAKDKAHDAINITVDNGEPHRVYARAWGKLTSTVAFLIAVNDDDQEVQIMLTPAEPDVYIDKIVFKRVR